MGRSWTAAVAVLVSACTGPAAAGPTPLVTRLPRLGDLQGITDMVYRVPDYHGLFYDNGRTEPCGHYPEVGDLSGAVIQGEYDSTALPLVFVRVRPSGEDPTRTLSDWVTKCGAHFSVGREDFDAKVETDNPAMPAGTTVLSVMNATPLKTTGSWPPSVQVVAATSGGVAFEAWAQAEGVDRQGLEQQLAAMVRSFLKSPERPDKPVAQWSPAELSVLFLIPGQTDGGIGIAQPKEAGARPEPSPEKTCDEDPLAAGSPDPAGVERLVTYSGSYPAAGPGSPSSTVYRSDVDYLARMRDWVAACSAHLPPVPAVCVPKGVHPELIPVTETVDGEPVVGYQRFEPTELPGWMGGPSSCGGKASAARTFRVGGLLVQASMPVDASNSVPDWNVAARALEAQVKEVVGVIHGVAG